MTEEERQASLNKTEEADGIEVAEITEDEAADLIKQIEEQRKKEQEDKLRRV